jgi:hypothetical protein
MPPKLPTLCIEECDMPSIVADGDLPLTGSSQGIDRPGSLCPPQDLALWAQGKDMAV